ncbi:hypothetical protein E8E14_005381 [Neopestalotiopsis sp. 37M]|nr:hypothetical protein E8E14_005381 [Neopestalotiopsis sp. 37M]
MKLSFLTFLLAALLQVRFCLAADDSTDTDVTIPACGLKCILEIVPDSVCSNLSNLTCICTNEEVIADLSTCVYASCSTRDALSTKKYSDVSCGRSHEDNSLQIIVTTPLFGALALLIWILRLVSRYLTGFRATWGMDDWIMVPVVIASIPMTCLSWILAKHGLGHDMWMVDFDDITYILYLYYWDEILYLFVVPATKISILCFYLRIFPGKALRVGSYVLIVLNVLYFVAFEVITIFQCTPIPGAWLEWDGEYEATCRDVNLQAWVAAAVCIVLDVALIALPMPELWNLNLSMKKKVQVMLMFAVGTFVTIVSILRLQWLLVFAKTTNVTQDFVPVGVWSTVETSVGIICACMPAMRSLFATLLPKVFGTTHQKSQYPTGNSTSGNDKSTNDKSISSRIKVKSEFVITSRTKGHDEGSFVELTPLDSDDEQHRHERKQSKFDFEWERQDTQKPAAPRESV